MHQATLGNYIWHRFFNCLENALMPVSGYTFDLKAKLDQVIQILFYFFIMFSIGKTDQLCIAILVILITHQTELLKVGCIHAQVNLVPLEDIYGWRAFQKSIKCPL